MAQAERRIKTKILTAYRCLDKDTVTTMGFGSTLSLGNTGALLEAPDPMPVGQVLELEFLLDNDQLVNVRAHVASVKHVKSFYNAEVVFDDLDDQAQRLITLQTGGKPSPSAKTKTPTKPKPKKK